MAKDDIFDHVYDNTNWMKKSINEDTRSGRETRHYIYVRVLSVLLFLSILANAVLGCLYLIKDTNMFLRCEPVTNCSNSDHEQSNTGCKYEENWKTFNYCPDLPEQWLKGKGSFYVFSSYNKTWSSSRQHCLTLGGDLVIINNTEEKEVLAQRLCITGESNVYWTGSSEGNRDGQVAVNCAVLKGNAQQDISCQREERSICEIPCR